MNGSSCRQTCTREIQALLIFTRLGKHSHALLEALGIMAEEPLHKMKASTSAWFPLCSSPGGTFPAGANSSSRKFMFPRRSQAGRGEFKNIGSKALTLSSSLSSPVWSSFFSFSSPSLFTHSFSSTPLLPHSLFSPSFLLSFSHHHSIWQVLPQDDEVASLGVVHTSLISTDWLY